MVCKHSKQSISSMFCGDAAGHFLPPMVVYKSNNVYKSCLRKLDEERT